MQGLCLPAVVPFPQAPLEGFSLPDWSHVLSSGCQSTTLIVETAEAEPRQSCRQGCARFCIPQAAPGPTGRVSPAGQRSSPALLCQGQPGGLRFNEVFVSHDFLHHGNGMNRCSGFKAGHRILVRAPLLILNLSKKAGAWSGRFFCTTKCSWLCCHPVCRALAAGPGAVGFSCSLTGRDCLLLPFISLLRGEQDREGTAWC